MEMNAITASAVVAPVVAAEAKGPASLDLEQELSSPDSTLSVSIGVSEGNRTPDGGFTPGYYGHTDIGNGKHNQGTFSRNGQDFATPEEADKEWLGRMRDVLPEYQEAAKSAGLDPGNPMLAGAFFDLYTQSPAAATAEGGFLDQLPTIAEQGISKESIVDARVASYHDPATGALDAPGFNNDLEWVKHDQNRRMDAVSSVVNGDELPETAAPEDTIITQGSTGSQVREMQNLLNQLGANLAADGDFGPNTDAAIKDFQREAGLMPADGVVGPKTMTALRDAVKEQQPAPPRDALQDDLLNQLEENEQPKAATKPGQTGEATATKSAAEAPAWREASDLQSVRDGKAILSRGHQGESVRELQQLLNKTGANLDADGRFGDQTLQAVQDFQNANGLKTHPGMEGMVGATTLSAIEANAKSPETGDVVYYSQNLNQYEASATCANTSMAMMMDTFGIRDDSVSRTPDYLYDTYGKVQDVAGMADVFNEEAKAAGKTVRATETQTASLDDLRDLAKSGEATVVGGYFTPNPGHFVVVTGYDEATDEYIVNDPRGEWNENYNGTHDTSKSGEGIRYDAAAFEDAVAPDGNVWMIEFNE